MVQKNEASRKTGLTRSGKRRDGVALVNCLDALYENRLTLQTMAGLLESCRYAPVAEIDPEVIGNADRMMLHELTRMNGTLDRLQKEIASR
jgi:hypothetical protein